MMNAFWGEAPAAVSTWTVTTWTLTKGLAVSVLILSGLCNWPWLLGAVSGRERGSPVARAVHLGFWSGFAVLGTVLGVYSENFIANFRDVGALLAGLTGGPLAGMLAGAVAGLHRLALGGPTGAACAVATVLAGAIGGVARRGRPIRSLSWRQTAAAVVAAELLHGLVVLALVRPWEVATAFLTVAILPMTAAGALGAVCCRWILAEAQSRLDSQLANARLLALMKDSLESTLDLVATLADAKDQYTASHSRKVAHYAVAIGGRLGLREPELATLWLAGIVHDLGKIAVPNQILDKPGPLDEGEWKVIRSHPLVGARILSSSRGTLRDIARFAEAHHERYDGKGYPHGVEQRDLLVSIVAVADALEAMTSHRPHRPALPVLEVIKQLEAGSGTQFHPEAAAAALDLLETEGPPHTWRVKEPRFRDTI